MQKKLLSLLMVTTCGIMYGGSAPTPTVKNEKVPFISDAEHTKNKKTYDELTAKIKSSQEQLIKEQQERDEIEVQLHTYFQRKNYRDALVKEAAGNKGAIRECETSSKNHADKINADAKRQDNGIERAWFVGVTDPLKDSRAGKEYDREDKRAQNKKAVDEKLSSEYADYSQDYSAGILPGLAQDLTKKEVAINTVYVPAFLTCSNCKSNRDAYIKCLAKQGVSEDAASEQFAIDFVGSAYEEAAEEARKRGILLMPGEIIDSAQKNEITKDAAAKAKVAQERFKKALNGESLDSKPELKSGEKQEQKTPTQNPPAPKPNVTAPDKK